MKAKLVQEVYNSLLDLINEYTPFDCSFITNTKEYKDLNDYFKSFFGESFKYQDIKKLYHNCYLYDSYIIKFNCKKTPKEILDIPEVVKTYYRNNFKYEYNNKVLYLGVEIQDYIKEYTKCNEEELYEVYVSLRRKGYEWIDVSSGNVFKVNNEFKIIDSDYIYPEGQANYINESKLSKQFREQYKKEN